jgi:pre-rRNA-processing protein TSR1
MTSVFGVKDMEELVDLLPDSSQEDLITENTPDGMEGEQTWPTEEELRQVDQQEGGIAKKTMRIPRGTSDYQAALWNRNRNRNFFD